MGGGMVVRRSRCNPLTNPGGIEGKGTYRAPWKQRVKKSHQARVKTTRTRKKWEAAGLTLASRPQPLCKRPLQLIHTLARNR